MRRPQPKAAIETESKQVFLTAAFGGKSRHSVLWPGLIEEDFI